MRARVANRKLSEYSLIWCPAFPGYQLYYPSCRQATGFRLPSWSKRCATRIKASEFFNDLTPSRAMSAAPRV